MHLECVVIVAYKKTIKREKQEGIMSARRKQLIALSVVLVCVIGMAAYGIMRVSNKTADKGNGFDVAMTDTDDKSEDGLKDSDKTIVIVTHSLDVVKELCDRAVWIYKGELRLDGDPIYVIDEYLKQVAIDHKEEKKKAIIEGKHHFKGAVFVDSPRDFATIKKSDEMLTCRGWQISDHDDAILEIKLDENEITDITRSNRQDVFEAYQEAYAGDLDADNIGWEIQVDLKDFSVGQHKLNVQCVEPNGNLLAEKNIQFILE